VKRFGQLVRELREERGLNRSQFAALAGVGHPSRIREVEDEAKAVDPHLSRVQQIARGFGMTLTGLMAKWEDVELVWLAAGRKATAEAKGATNATDLTERGGTMDDLGQILMKVLDSVPAERKEDFVSHCTNFGMHLRRGRDHVATGTDPKD
jgi:transcriptional regulator with XRE-family HTH domain